MVSVGRCWLIEGIWHEHTQSCVQGKKVACPVCDKQYASVPSMQKYITGPNMGQIWWSLQVVSCVLFVISPSRSKRPGGNISPIVLITLPVKVLTIAGLLDVRWLTMVSPV